MTAILLNKGAGVDRTANKDKVEWRSSTEHPGAGLMEDKATEPGNYHFAITPNDAVNLTVVPRCLFIGVAGDVVIHDAAGTAATYKNWVGFLPFRARRVLATGTTATNILGIY